jgi:hypothetical protein
MTTALFKNKICLLRRWYYRGKQCNKNVQHEFGFLSIPSIHKASLLNVYMELFEHENHMYIKFKFAIENNLIQQYLESVFLVTRDEIYVTAARVLPNVISAIIADYACTPSWDTFDTLGIYVSNDHMQLEDF